MSVGEIRLNDVNVEYRRQPAIAHVSGAFAAGSLTAIAGPNGAGKSTLLKAIVGEARLASGTIDRGAMANNDLGYLPQAAEINRRFPISVADMVLLGDWKRCGAFGGASRRAIRAADDALAGVGLPGFGGRHIGALSAGQFQRVLFARLLLQDACVILLDEPFTAIDQRTIHDLISVVLRWHAEGRTVIAVLHDFDQVRSHFPETLLLAREVVAWGDTSSVMTLPNLAQARALADGWGADAGLAQTEAAE